MLNVLSIEEAKSRLLHHVHPINRTEIVTLDHLAGRTLAADIRAGTDVPGFDRSAVDGLAVRATDTFGASETLPAMLQLIGAVTMGHAPAFRINPGECAAVPTGGALPEGADAMVMIEYVDSTGDHLQLVNRPAAPGDHLILRGDDFKASQTVLAAGRIIRTADIGTLAALDIEAAEVIQKPRVAIISTGDELVEAGQAIRPGQIHDVNTPALAALVRESGGEPVRYGIVADDLDQLDQCLKKALADCDLVLISGGSSVGEKDHLQAAVEAQGEPGILFHGIAVKPGKPTLGGVTHGRVILGLPGHPLAAWFMARWLAMPLIHALQGAAQPIQDRVPARTSCRIPSNAGRESIIPVRLLADGTGWLAEPVFTKSSLITVLSQSDGCIRISRDLEGLEAGTLVTVYPFH
jgi:molybdopterin molybdotransferase